MGETSLRVPVDAVGQSVLRRTVRAVCASVALPLDRVDDLILVCEELLSRSVHEVTFRFRGEVDRVDVAVPAGALGQDAGPIVAALASRLETVSDPEPHLVVTIGATPPGQ